MDLESEINFKQAYIRTYIQLLHQADKDDERRGGGNALIYTNFLSAKCKIDAFQFSQFECIFCSDVRNIPTTSICVVLSCMYHLYDTTHPRDPLL